MSQLTQAEALAIMSGVGIKPETTYQCLSVVKGMALLDLADIRRYRRPRRTEASRLEAFLLYVKRRAGRGT